MFLSMPPNTMPWNGEMDRKTQLLLDPQTYQVIGMRAASTGTDPVRPIAGKGRTVPWPPKGTIIESMAWAQVTMVSGPVLRRDGLVQGAGRVRPGRAAGLRQLRVHRRDPWRARVRSLGLLD